MTDDIKLGSQGIEKRYSTPQVRHLAWICSAAQLYRGGDSFNPGSWLPDDWTLRLADWDQNPAGKPALLQSEVAPRKLGAYFEVLYQVLIEDLLGWKVEARNQQIIVEGRTLGELDFLVRNKNTGSLEHHEIAVKFYLGYPHPDDESVRWYGPNSRDRLDLKTQRLLEHQSTMALTDAGRGLLKRLGLDEPVVPKVFMPGYLFLPLGQPLALPDQVDTALATGSWQRYSQFEMGNELWVPLIKPDWLGPYLHLQQPDAELTTQWMKQCEARKQPCLLARVIPTDFGWSEVARCFFVPDSWPEAAPTP